ncbi:CBS domain-containing protein [Anaerobaca lacustris]|uniref:CBS domain-containing protein n=1 Tax=Anaerobaca lacustris TaxID=3044600 RepID=A0AAW6TQ87_9BACT|nr:CBS domain-containing protein [Sedimentisphaerales bacterium M17dextr]
MGTSTDHFGAAGTPHAILPCRLPSDGKRLKVSDIMGREIITANADDSVFAAAKRMSENNISCVVVTDEEMVIGILTDKDILKGIAADDTDFHRLRISQRMSSPVEVIPPDDLVVVAGQLMETRGIKRLPVVDAGALVGIVTQTDIMRGLISISPLGAVSEVMSAKVATIETGATIAEAARIMAANGISCLVAMHRQELAGILTEKDLLKRIVALHKDPTTTQVVEIMSFPVVAIPPDYSVLSAGRKMDTMRLHRLVVMDRTRKVCGVITQTDIMRAVRREMERLQKAHPLLDVELRTVLECLTDDTEKLRGLLGAMGDVARETEPTDQALPDSPSLPETHPPT